MRESSSHLRSWPETTTALACASSPCRMTISCSNSAMVRDAVAWSIRVSSRFSCSSAFRSSSSSGRSASVSARTCCPRMPSFSSRRRRFQAFLAALQRLENGLRAGRQAPLQRGQGETDRPLARAGELVRLAHFRLHVVGHRFVERGFEVGQRVVDRVRPAFGKERRAVEPHHLLFHHAAHQVRCIYLVDAIAELAVEAIGVQQRQEELEVLFLAVVRRGRHQQQMPGLGAQPFGKLETPGLFQFCAVEVRRELVRFVEDHQIPRGRAELVLQFLVARHLVEPDDQVIVVLKGIAAGRSQLQAPARRCETPGRTSQTAHRATAPPGCPAPPPAPDGHPRA